MMVVIEYHDDEPQLPCPTMPELFPVTAKVQDNDLRALITDFFDWLETIWQLPIFSPSTVRTSLPLPLALTEELYTIQDLAHLYGYDEHHISILLKRHGIFPLKYNKKRYSSLYKKHDLVPLLDRWEWKRLLQTLDQWWIRFFSPACCTCRQCQRFEYSPVTQQMYCNGNISLALLRSVFTDLLEKVHSLGSITAWWHAHHADTWRRETCSSWGIVLIYLLDQRLIHLSNDELVQLKPICNKNLQDLTRLWRHRRPEEYAQFLQAVKATNYKNGGQRERALTVFCLLVLLKHGLPGIRELGRILSSEEIQQVCGQHRLVTKHLGGGIFLPYSLTSDIRVGHIILDDIRFSFWRYAADQKRIAEKPCWYLGPHNWSLMLVSIIEQALAAPVYEGATGILSRRPETERNLVNPWHIADKERSTDTGYALLPVAVQTSVMIYLTYCHQERHMELTTLVSRVGVLLSFFTWVRRQGKLGHYPSWSRESAQEIFRAYASIGCAEVQMSTRRGRLRYLAHFFATLADLEHPVPAGYRLLFTLEKGDSRRLRAVPREEVMDRVFRDGVCQLSYDPFARLALTIQYYCGTRVTETCDLHLFCILEDRDGHAYLLIPRGKSKEERPFPIVELGMGPLLQYMDEIVVLRLSPDGTSRTLGKTNFRYLDHDPQRARDWHYLFDRVPDAHGVVKRRGRLSSARVREALAEALRMAAKVNPEGLLQHETSNGSCQHRRRKGQKCFYFAAQEGITICPCCQSKLSGKRGARCRRILKEDFICDGIAQDGEVFCPKCDTPLAQFFPITPHLFRHNSVSRAHRAGVSLVQNMRLHGHKTVPMHMRYLHLLLEDTTNEVRHIFAEKRLRDVRQMLGSAPGQIIEGGMAYTVSLEQYLGLTLQRTLKRRTYGIWGGFWAGALAQRGIASPLCVEDEIVIPEDTYEHTVAQYWYEALGLAVSEVAFEYVTAKKWRADVPAFLDRKKIEMLVQFHLRHVQDSLASTLGMRLMERDILEQRRFLDELAEKLRPWWQHLGTIDQLAQMFAPGGGHAFQKQLSSAEPTS